MQILCPSEEEPGRTWKTSVHFPAPPNLSTDVLLFKLEIMQISGTCSCWVVEWSNVCKASRMIPDPLWVLSSLQLFAVIFVTLGALMSGVQQYSSLRWPESQDLPVSESLTKSVSAPPGESKSLLTHHKSSSNHWLLSSAQWLPVDFCEAGSLYFHGTKSWAALFPQQHELSAKAGKF